MLHRRTLLRDHDGLAVLDVVCSSAAQAGWSAPEPGSGYQLVFPRRGVFVRRVDKQELLLDPGLAYFERPDQPQQVAHPQPGGDACTVLVLPAPVLAQLTGGEPHVPDGPVPTGGSLDLAQRTLIARLKSGASSDELEATERIVRLAADVLEAAWPGPVQCGQPSTARARQRLVEAARELIATEPAAVRLADLAHRLGVSPHHLSRVFHAATGQTLARYRMRLRVRLALERIEAGERDLAGLAADLGFADHAHLTRTLRREVGHPPAHVRRLLAGASALGS